jgi:hypothetical protein
LSGANDDICYGVEANGKLSNCFGVAIRSYGAIMICYFKQNGECDLSKPWAKFTKGEGMKRDYMV